MWNFWEAHGKKYPKRKICSTIIWITFPHEYAIHLINIHENFFVIYKAKPTLLSLECLLCFVWINHFLFKLSTSLD